MSKKATIWLVLVFVVLIVFILAIASESYGLAIGIIGFISFFGMLWVLFYGLKRAKEGRGGVIISVVYLGIGLLMIAATMENILATIINPTGTNIASTAGQSIIPAAFTLAGIALFRARKGRSNG